MSTNDPWCWPEDYRDAHYRHWEDAELLLQEGRLANADHLYGLSAECGLKFLLVRARGHLVRQERIHIDDLWPHFRLLSNLRRLPLPGLPQQNPFADWRAQQRYAHRSNFNPNFVDNHRQGALFVRKLVSAALQGGIR